MVDNQVLYLFHFTPTDSLRGGGLQWLLAGEGVTGVSGRSLKSRVATLAAAAVAGQEQHSRVQAGSMATQA